MPRHDTSPMIWEHTANAEYAIQQYRDGDSTVLCLDEITVGCGCDDTEEEIHVGVRVWDEGTETSKQIARGRESDPVLYDTIRFNCRRNGVIDR